ncbi:MAG: hypothetical protein NUV77_21470, partial [Thermoguttaceae bacterium]|nr:hypothetical protein [Thermoguttaceae bacterium]
MTRVMWKSIWGGLFFGGLWTTLILPVAGGRASLGDVQSSAAGIDISQGIGVVLGLPDSRGPEFVIDLASRRELLVYFQAQRPDEEAAVRKAAEAAGLLGKRVFVDRGPWRRIHLADNLAGA